MGVCLCVRETHVVQCVFLVMRLRRDVTSACMLESNQLWHKSITITESLSLFLKGPKPDRSHTSIDNALNTAFLGPRCKRVENRVLDEQDQKARSCE